MKKIWAVGLAVAAASTGAVGYGAVAAPATAAGSSPAIYYHGTSRDAHFRDRATCEAYSRYWLKQVASKASQVTLIPAYSEPGVTGPDQRASCYPVSTGQWTYLVAYFLKKGAPLTRTDHLVDLNTRFSPAFPADDEAQYAYLHQVTQSAASTSVATCNKYANATAATIRSRTNLRLLVGQSCFSAEGKVGYTVLYTATKAGAAIARGDQHQLVGTTLANAFPMLDVLGYDYTYLANPTEQAQLAKRHAQVLKMTKQLPR